ncbi:MAG TPA: hypothetical protein DCZ95_08455 [Verrucomicrobia bacterium]|nr:MAG: hypothetical protein A2X46_12490 [Lentisphaerae bacterium GWF2_57_35]HBA84109.1 hypothetical protein [Verrucomicrobiota bacterium]
MAKSKSKPAVSTGTSAVLIVDDELILAKTLSQFLERQGCRTHVCHTAQEAMQLLKTSAFDVILTDLELPDTQGLDFIHYLRKTAHASRIIVLTAHPSLEAVDSSDNIHNIKHLQKPFDLDTLWAAIFAD